VGAVVGPVAGGRHPLAGRNHRSVADRRDQVAMATRLKPQNAEAVVRVVEGDPLDEASQEFHLGVALIAH
jgi:hypothetical protein